LLLLNCGLEMLYFPDMAMPNWDVERATLRGRFLQGTIANASRKELEYYLIVLANSTLINGSAVPTPAHAVETDALANAVRHLLQVRISEELHWRSMVAARIAAGISVLALCVAGFQAWDAHQLRVAAASTIPAHGMPTAKAQSQPAKILSPAKTTLPLTNGNVTPILSPARTNR
jgi:hypothetical protein